MLFFGNRYLVPGGRSIRRGSSVKKKKQYNVLDIEIKNSWKGFSIDKIVKQNKIIKTKCSPR